MSGPSSPASTEEQRRLAGRYVLRQPVGRGGAGVVWRAEDELLGRTVAIKECMLPPTVDDADRDKLLTRVMREARTAARLDHPALVTVFDVVQESGRPWIVMEYVESRSLSQVVRQDGPLPAAQVVDIGLTLLDALRVAHGAGVLHRDVKPANVLLTESGNVVLTDFGIAATTGDPTLTTSGMLLGSPSYMPPERARGEPATPDSDVWSLAATLYTLVEGTTPYSGDHPLAVLSAVAEHRRRPMELAGPLEPLLADILDSEPEGRPGELTVQRRLERIKAELAAQGPTTTGGTPIRSIADFGEKSAAARTARLEAQRPSRRKRQHEPDQPVASTDGVGAAQMAPQVEEPAPAVSDGAATPGQEPEAKPRRSLFGRRRNGSAAAGAAGAAAAGAAAEADRHGDQAWDFDDFFASHEAGVQAPERPATGAPAEQALPDGQAQAVDSEVSSAEPETSPVIESREPAAEAVAAPPEAAPEPAQAEPAGTEQAQPETPQSEAPRAETPQSESAPAAPASAAPAQRPVAPPVDTPSAPALRESHAAPASPREPAAPSSPADSPDAEGRRSRRTPLLLGLGALVVVAIVALALVLSGGGSSKPKAVPGVPGPATGAGTPGGNSGGSSGSNGSGSNGSSTQSAGPNAGTGAAPPAGWQTYHDPQYGWSIAVPPGFTRSTGGNSRQADFRDGQGRLMRVEINPHANPSAISDWRTYEPTFARQVSNYQRVRMDPVDGGDGSRAADWEFTYSQGGADLHVLNRGVVDGRTAHALYWQTPQSEWDSSTQLRDQIFSTFQPPPQ